MGASDGRLSSPRTTQPFPKTEGGTVVSRYDVFISYRREGGEHVAGRLRESLVERGYRVFLDVETLRSGDFNEELLRIIESTPNFIVICSPGCFDRCSYENDWVRRELRHALKHSLVIPVIVRGFEFPESLPPDIYAVRNMNGPELSFGYYDAFVDRLCEFFHDVAPRRKPKKPMAIVFGCTIMAVLIALMATRFNTCTNTSVEPAVEVAESSDCVLSFDGGGATGGEMSSETYESGSSVTIPPCKFKYENHVFVRWEDGQGTAYQQDDTVTITDDLRLTAVWEAQTCEVKFLGAGADGGSTNSIVTESGLDIVLPACGFYRYGYEFDCWSNELGDAYRPGDTLRVQGDTTFAAQWVAKNDEGDETDKTVTQPVEPSTESSYTFPQRWSGSYLGNTINEAGESVPARRMLWFDLNEADGQISGTCSVGKDDGSNSVEGTFRVSGSYNHQTGEITISGTEWVIQGDLWGMRNFWGTVGSDLRSMSGTCVGTNSGKEGDWSVSVG